MAYFKNFTFALTACALTACGPSVNYNEPAPIRKPTVSKPAKPSLSLSGQVKGSKLVADYEANELRAEQTYDGKLYLIEIRIDNIGKDILGSPYISYRGSGFAGVNLYFDKEHAPTIARMNKGSIVKVKCVIGGKTLGSVIGRDCTQ